MAIFNVPIELFRTAFDDDPVPEDRLTLHVQKIMDGDESYVRGSFNQDGTIRVSHGGRYIIAARRLGRDSWPVTFDDPEDEALWLECSTSQ